MAETPESSNHKLTATPVAWVAGDPGYEPVADPPETFFHVIVALDPRDEKFALLVHMTYERGGDTTGALHGRRYLVNASDEADAAAQVEVIEQQIGAEDAEHIAEHGEGSPFHVALVVKADPLIHARRDPEPAGPAEGKLRQFDAGRAERGRQRALAAGIG